jgi:hypothetical protein
VGQQIQQRSPCDNASDFDHFALNGAGTDGNMTWTMKKVDASTVEGAVDTLDGLRISMDHRCPD